MTFSQVCKLITGDKLVYKVTTYPSFLNQCTNATEQMHQQILNAGALDAFLFTDLATNAGSTPDVQNWDELRQSVHEAALAQLLGVLAKSVAWHNVGDDACKRRERTKTFLDHVLGD